MVFCLNPSHIYYTFVLVICWPFQRLNWGSKYFCGTAIADLGWLNIGQLQVLPAYRQPDTRFLKPYASLILILTNKAPLWTNKPLAANSSSFIVVKICSAIDKWGLTKLSHGHYKPTWVRIYRKNMFLSIKNVWSPCKNSKTTRDQSIHVNYSSIHLVNQSL